MIGNKLQNGYSVILFGTNAKWDLFWTLPFFVIFQWEWLMGGASVAAGWAGEDQPTAEICIWERKKKNMSDMTSLPTWVD